jgi:hypothetical protein
MFGIFSTARMPSPYPREDTNRAEVWLGVAKGVDQRIRLQHKCHCKAPAHRTALCPFREMHCIQVCPPSLEPHVRSKPDPEEARPHLTSSQGVCSHLQQGGAPSLPLKTGTPKLYLGQEEQKRQGGSPKASTFFRAPEETNGGESPVPFKRQLGWQKWEGFTAGNDCW